MTLNTNGMEELSQGSYTEQEEDLNGTLWHLENW